MNDKHTIKLHVQMVFLMMNAWRSKHVEDTKNLIKALIWKVCICWFTLLKHIRNYVLMFYVYINKYVA